MTSPTPKCHLLLARAQASLFGWRAQKPNTTSRFLRTTFSVNHFTVVRSVTKSINEREAGRDLALILSIFVFKRNLVCIKNHLIFSTKVARSVSKKGHLIEPHFHSLIRSRTTGVWGRSCTV